jgi:hypothetical protein
LATVAIAPGVEGVVSPATGTVWISRLGDHRGVVWGAVLGNALPYLLSVRGTRLMHASCVVGDGGAVAFVGAPLVGKSSVAASLVASGWRALADDALVLRATSRGVEAVPSFPALRLWSPLAARMAGGRELTPVRAGVDKSWLLLDERREWAAGSKARLMCVAVLGGERGVQRLRTRPAVMALLSALYHLPNAPALHRQRNLELAVRIARTVPVLRLELPAGFALDPALGELVLERLGTAAAS